MKATIKVTAKFTVELNQSTVKNEKKKAFNIKEIGDSVKIKGKTKYCMSGILEVWIDNYWWRRHVNMAVEGRSERRDWK